MSRLFPPEENPVVRIYKQLTHLVETGRGMPPTVGSAPMLTREQVSVLIETAFWASLRSNEGRPTRVCLAIAAPETFHDVLAFATPFAYDELFAGGRDLCRTGTKRISTRGAGAFQRSQVQAFAPGVGADREALLTQT